MLISCREANIGYDVGQGSLRTRPSHASSSPYSSTPTAPVHKVLTDKSPSCIPSQRRHISGRRLRFPSPSAKKTPFVSDSAMCAPANTDIPNLEHVFSLYGLGSCANRAWHLQLYMICLHLSLSSALKHVCNPKTTQLQL